MDEFGLTSADIAAPGLVTAAADGDIAAIDSLADRVAEAGDERLAGGFRLLAAEHRASLARGAVTRTALRGVVPPIPDRASLRAIRDLLDDVGVPAQVRWMGDYYAVRAPGDGRDADEGWSLQKALVALLSAAFPRGCFRVEVGPCFESERAESAAYVLRAWAASGPATPPSGTTDGVRQPTSACD